MDNMTRGFSALLWLLGMAIVAYAQIYTPWVVPYYSTCNARHVENILCVDDVDMYLGQVTVVSVSRRSVIYQHSAEDSANTTEFMRASPAEANTAAVSAAANSSAARILALQDGTLRNFGCVTSAAAHAGATFVYRSRRNDADTSQTCTVTDATTSCNDTTNTANVVANDGITISKTDSAATDGTQVQHCAVELLY